MHAFARHFIESRLGGYRKDMQICLTPIPSPSRAGVTHAYFAALGASCGFLEYMAGLYAGDINGLGWPQVASWTSRYMRQPDYDKETTRVFFCAFRHSVAHRGIATGIWLDRSKRPNNRITWKVSANSRRPACQLVAEKGTLTKDPPWPCLYTHRMHIHLKALELDLSEGVGRYVSELVQERTLLDNFTSCMRQMYPAT